MNFDLYEVVIKLLLFDEILRKWATNGNVDLGELDVKW